jgi:hypothetical protein
MSLFKRQWPLWDRPTASVVFGPKGANGYRRGIGFQRIWGDATRLKVSYSYGMNKSKAEDVKIAIYRVFSPEK